MSERWTGLTREWADQDGDGKIVSMGHETLPVLVCDRCGAVVPESYADVHDRWHLAAPIEAEERVK